MANLGQKHGIFHIRFHGKGFKYSLRTDDDDGAAARHVVELTTHHLLTGQATIPDGVGPGDFILSGGTLQKAPAALHPPLHGHSER